MSGNIPLPRPPESANVLALACRGRDTFTGLTSTTVTLSDPATGAPEMVFKNGLLLTPSQYSISGTTVTLSTALVSSDEVIVHYQFRPQ